MGPVEQLLRDSLIEFKEHGGLVGAYQRDGQVCAIGAVMSSYYRHKDKGWPQDSRSVACELLLEGVLALPNIKGMGIKGMPPPNSVARFNDHFASQKNLTPIRNIFRRAIALAVERGL